MPMRLRWAVIVGALLMLPLLWQLFGPRGVPVEVVRKTWRFEIEIEKRILESSSGWCDEMPAEARDISRRLLADPAGARPGLAEHCRYALPQWRPLRMMQAQGEAPTAPRWPQTALSELPPDQLGAERPGKRREFYEIRLQASKGQHWTCRLPQRQWQDLAPVASLRLQVDRQGVADCASITNP